jgi:H+-translocating NAD(P) transhydrogenase subunit beta
MLASTFLTDRNFVAVLYIVSFGLFIYGLSGLTGPKTAVRGNRIAAVGMAVAIIAALLVPDVNNIGLIIIGVAIGTVIGVPAARQVKMTQMPQMVALFNGVGGGAVALIAWVEFRDSGGFAEGTPTYVAIFSCFAAIVGSVSFWGSNIAFAKLQELIDGKPVKPFGSAQVLVNGLLLAIAIACGVAIVAGSHDEILIIVLLVAAAIVGNFLVLPIGGADMPVVISTLNAFTGLSAAATGVALNNTSLIVAGMIVGASGTLLTQQMAVAMNRTITSVLLGGFGGEVAAAAGPAGASGTVRSTSAADVAIQMAYARQVVVVPGYGMAVSQAQHAVREMAKMLEAKGVTVKYAIHPVAGRMPGHMNVLLAEADVPYEQLKEMDDINGEFARTDVSVVIGANDVTNPDARNKADSPIYGMPILNVDESQSVIVLKRSMSSGYAGIDNPLFVNPKTSMLFGDAKASVEGITEELKIL